MKRMALIASLLLGLIFLLTGCSSKAPTEAELLSDKYSSALILVQKGDFTAASKEFTELGYYQDSSLYAVYCKSLMAAAGNDFLAAENGMNSLDGFLDSALWGKYYQARAYESLEMYENARTIYQGISYFSDSSERLASLPGLISERDYQSAVSYEESGQLSKALGIFERLSGYKDSSDHIAAIHEKQKALAYADAEKLEKEGKLEEAREAFAALESYQDSAERVSAIDGKILERTYQKAVETEQKDDPVTAYDLFVSLQDYKDSADRAAKLYNEATYQKALKIAEAGQYREAAESFAALADYKDSREKARLFELCKLASKVEYKGSGLFAFKMEEYDKWGYVDVLHNYDVQPAWDTIGQFADDVSIVSVKNYLSDEHEYGLIDRHGNQIVPCKYLAIRKGENGFYVGVTQGKNYSYQFALIHASKGELSTWKALGDSFARNEGNRYSYDYQLGSLHFNHGAVIAQAMDGTWSLLNSNGEQILYNATSLEIRTRGSQPAVVLYQNDEGYRFYSVAGYRLQEETWKAVLEFSEGYVAVQNRNYDWGFVRLSDMKTTVEPQYAYANSYSDGLAAVYKDNLWGFIDQEGNMVIEPTYYATGAFHQGACLVSDGQNLAVIDKNNQIRYFKESLYQHALALDESGRFEDAIAAYEALGDYSDSKEKAVAAREKINAEMYAKAVDLEQAGKLEEAAQAFEWLGEYTDSRERAAAIRERILADAYTAAQTLEKEGRLDEAIEAYRALGDYQNSSRHADEIVESINRSVYTRAETLENAGKFEDAILVYQTIPEYSDVAERIAKVEEKIRQRDYNAAAALEEAGKYEDAIAAFSAMGDYSDSRERIPVLEEKIRKRDYNAAAALEEAGDYQAASEAFKALGDYQDSAARVLAIADKVEEQRLATAYQNAAKAEEDNDLEKAEAGFAELKKYKDSESRLASIQEKIRARDYQQALDDIKAGNYERAISLLEKLGDYADSRAQLAEAQTGFAYQTARDHALAGKLSQAYEEFLALGQYKDSERKAEIVGNLTRAGETREIAKGVLIYEFHGVWGIANLNENILTQATYTSIENEKNTNYSKYELLKVFKSGGERYSSWGYEYKNAFDTYGYINYQGLEIIPCSYFALSDFNTIGQCTVALVKGETDFGSYYYKRAYLGIMDYQGRTVTKAQWRTMGSSQNNDWSDSNSASYFSDRDFTVIAPMFENGRMKVQNPDGLWGFINTNGKVLGQVKWYSIGDFRDGMAMVCEQIASGTGWNKTYTKNYGFIDEQGNPVGEVRWAAVNDFSNGLAAVSENGLWGFIDKTNTLVIPCQYAEVNAFTAEGTCDVKTPQGTWKVIDQSGNDAFFGGNKN